MYKKNSLLVAGAGIGHLGKKVCDVIEKYSNAYTRKIGKCPNCNCKRVLRYPDIETWETKICPGRPSVIIIEVPPSTCRKQGTCPDCGQAITVQAVMFHPHSEAPTYLSDWHIVTESRD